MLGYVMAEAQSASNTTKKRGPKGPSKELSDNDFSRLLNMVRIQCTQTEICSILDMSDTTLNRRLKERGYENFEDLYKRHNDEGRMSLLFIFKNQKDKAEQTISGEHVHAYKWLDDDGQDN